MTKLVDIQDLARRWAIEDLPSEYVAFFESDLPSKLNGRVLKEGAEYPFCFSNTLLDFVFSDAGFNPGPAADHLLEKDGKLIYLPRSVE